MTRLLAAAILGAIPLTLTGATGKVELSFIGIRSANTPCLLGNLSAAPGDVFEVDFDARLIASGPNITGVMKFAPGSDQAFEFPGQGFPSVTFRHGLRPVPDRLRIRVKPDAVSSPNRPLNLQAFDNDNVASETRTCVINLERHLFSVQEINVVGTAGSPRIQAVIRNSRNAVLENVPWRISAKRAGLTALHQTLRTGVVARILPNSTATFSIPLSTRTGRFSELAVYLDEAKTLAETDPRSVFGNPPPPDPNTADNIRMTSRAFPLEIQELDPVQASAAGATFPHNMLDPSICMRLGVGDWLDRSWDGWADTPRARGVLFQADCSQNPFPAPVTGGGRADPEAYKGFLLKNGWVISSIDEMDAYVGTVAFDPAGLVPSGSTGVFRWMTRPVVGSNNPAMQAHVAANAFGIVKRGVRIFIEGPAGLSPYR